MEDALLQIDVKAELKKIREQLKDLPQKIEAEDVLVKAINTAARKAKKELISGVRKEYALVDETGLNQTKEGKPRLKLAKPQVQYATVISKGPMQSITRFTYSPNNRSSAAAAKVKASSSLKSLVHPRTGIKAFAVKFSSGHVEIVERKPGKSYSEEGAARREQKYGKYADMTKIVKMDAPAIPIMMGNENVQEPVQQMTYEVLHAAIQKQIDKTIRQAQRG